VCVRRVGKAYVKYFSPQAAAYARDKISNFQYPPGYRIVIQFLARCVHLAVCV